MDHHLTTSKSDLIREMSWILQVVVEGGKGPKRFGDETSDSECFEEDQVDRAS